MEKIYQERVDTFREKYEQVKKAYNYNSLFRGVVFIGLVWLLIFYLRTENPLWLIATLAVGVVFYLLVLRHRKLQDQGSYFDTLSKLNEDEIKRTKLDLKAFDTGSQYLQENHPYQADLDIFGGNSLYQLVNRCQIGDSRDLLASWLSAPSDKSEIIARQHAVTELKDELDWCQDFMATSRLAINQRQKNDPAVSNKDLLAWIGKDISFSKSAVWKAIAILSNIVVIGLLGAVILDLLPYQVLYIPIIFNAIFLGITLRHMKDITRGIDKSYYMISTYQKTMELIESKTFTSLKLRGLQSTLNHGGASATKSIKALAELTHRLSSRANMLYIMVDVLFLLDAYLLVDLFRWKKSHRDDVSHWLEAVNAIECLISLAGFSHTNPKYVFPEITEKPFFFKATNLGHPLIHADQKVTNNYVIDGKGCVDIITGSNMSGKSTFQRTIGINMVLAQIGAPVDASALSMGLTQIFTSMRTKDNLAENTSSFYAELKRIRQLLNSLEQDDSTFFLLDEILKGTNSEDRHLGAMSLAKKLTQKPAFGLISTHDLTLGKLANEEPTIRNYSFNSEIDGNKIAFDYKLTEGLCKSFNASKLMENMGIM